MQSVAQNTDGQKMDWKGALTRPMARLRQFISNSMSRAALRDEFIDLDRRGSLDAVLDDIGLTRPELDRIVRGYPKAGRLLPMMAKRLGIDINKLDPRSRYQLGQSCAMCVSHSRCQRWLSKAPAESTENKEFCPNADVFEAILAHKKEGPAQQA